MPDVMQNFTLYNLQIIHESPIYHYITFAMFNLFDWHVQHSQKFYKNNSSRISCHYCTMESVWSSILVLKFSMKVSVINALNIKYLLQFNFPKIVIE